MVTVRAPYPDHKHSFQKIFGKNLAIFHSKLFYKENLISFIKFRVSDPDPHGSALI
jgi:hypothetical protein